MEKIIRSIYPGTKLSELIVDCPDRIAMLQRLGIAFGFRDQSIKEIASRYGINIQAFIAMLQVFERSVRQDMVLDRDAVRDVLAFLKVSHAYFREKQIPDIRELIVSFAQSIPVKYSGIIVSFFDGYIDEVNEHFRYEDDVVFPYIEKILDNPSSNGFKISEFEKNHTDIEQKLLDLKNILIKYIPEEVTSEYRVQILRELILLERDLMYHSFIEDHLLVPTIKQMEKEIPD